MLMELEADMEYGNSRQIHGFMRMKPAILWDFPMIITMRSNQMAP